MRKLPFLERSLRRSRVYRGRIARMATQKTLSSPCVFMHLPKCGGTSLSEGLYSLVPLNQKIGILDSASIRRALSIKNADVNDPRPYHDEGDRTTEVMAFREMLLLMHLAHDCRLVHGHVLFSETAYRHFGDRYKFVTIMRDPIARTLSNYKMASANGVFDGSLEAFVDSAMGRRMALHNLRYFSGQAEIAPGEEAGAMERAKAAMPKFSVIGFIEDQERFVEKFHDVFGSRPSIGHYNKGAEKPAPLDQGMRQRLEALCAPDIELYELAKRLT
ncbi:sulfotransferase family 2 domain-containing protein [Aurantimonas sp. Leaf443]|uniref:sulfotransferase family 2 domain-containing protein n=1 Tax=Aurantimonas sp. Leaf443 TaxID=1736378 RepID=UPI0006F60464|nr:sulfotransferase family 2 domain-containing protein [Aurantimonas sp. Leaf443]KQT85080.1 hypothetical protein ASG48_07270 [Aurantimonas sp. Leaf443]